MKPSAVGSPNTGFRSTDHESLAILSVDRTTLEMATTFPGSDFEDNLQIACAMEATLDAIVTRNAKDFAGSPVQIMTPAELLALLAKAPDA